MTGSEAFLLADWLIDPASRRASRGADRRRLSPKAMSVLMTLVAAQGNVVRRADLMDAVWPDVVVGEEVLTQVVAELRRALGDSCRASRLIETVHKSGYRLLADVRPVGKMGATLGGLAASDQEEANSVLDSLVDGRMDMPAQCGAIDLHAYAAYLEACRHFDCGGSTHTQTAVDGFSRIIASHPRYVPAYAGLAKALTFVDMYYTAPGEPLAKALAACETAIRLDPGAADLQAAHGLALAAAGDVERGYARFKSALNLRPNSFDTHYLLGRTSFAHGDHTLAAAMLEHAARLKPADFHSLVLAAKARRRLGDEARATADMVRAEQRIDVHLGAHPGDFRALCDKACCLVDLGNPQDAFALSERLLGHHDPMSYYLACFFSRAGEVRQAIETLEAAVDRGWSHGAMLARDPDLDPLRGEPRFRNIERVLAVN